MAVNKMNKPITIAREQNSVAISWKNVDSLSDSVCVLQVLDDIKQWKMMYWGSKTEIKIKNLAPCSYYNFRIKRERDDEKAWIYFKAATSEGPYLTMHFTRAIKFGKTPLIRKIAHARPLLLEVENKEMKTPLCQAVEKGDSALVNLLITLGANVNGLSSCRQRSALMSAVYLGHLQVANLLIDKGAHVNSVDINGLNILHFAVDANNLESVKFALKQGVDINSQDRSGWAPLHRAVILNCNAEIVDFLLQTGASKRLKDKNGFDFPKHLELASKNI